MQFSTVFAVTFAAVTASAAPSLIAAPSCKGGSVYCKQSVGSWSPWSSQSQKCSGANTYCCITEALLSVADCTNILDGNKVEVPISILDNLTLKE